MANADCSCGSLLFVRSSRLQSDTAVLTLDVGTTRPRTQRPLKHRHGTVKALLDLIGNGHDSKQIQWDGNDMSVLTAQAQGKLLPRDGACIGSGQWG